MARSLRFLANLFHVFGYCVLFFSLYSCECVYAVRELASHQLDSQKLSLLTASPCTASTKGLQVAHKNGPCSPLGHENPSPTSREILLHNQFRVRSLNSISPQGGVLILQEILDTGNFGVEVGFGTPKVILTLMFDTGSPLTWINCTESIFDPSKSSTFSSPMTDDCKSPPPPCNYSVDYHDKSSSKGSYASDTITFSSTAIFSEFVFGCGHDIKGYFGSAHGILGLGFGTYSLMRRTYNAFKQMFCYCIPSSKGSAGFLVFGDHALQACNNPELTISLDARIGERYYVKLIGITILGQRLSLNSSLRTILDTGTHIGRLPKSVYNELSSLFLEVMSQLHPNATKTTGNEFNEGCYDTGGLPFIKDPFMTLLFDDFKELKLDVLKNDSQVCLGFIPSEDEKEEPSEDEKEEPIIIIGNIQQRNLMIHYDVSGQQVAFRRSDCGP